MRAQASGATRKRTAPVRQVAAFLVLTTGFVLAGVSASDTADAASSVVDAWSTPAQIPSALSYEPAGMVEYNGLLFAAWSGESSPTHIYYASYNGAGWDAPAAVPSALTNAGSTPALAIYDKDLYLVWQGQKSPYSLWYSAFNGSTWSSQARVPSALTTQYSTPGLAGFDGKLYLGWIGAQPNTQFWYSAFNGTSWTTQTTIPGSNMAVYEGADTPFAAYKGKLYASWESASSSATNTYTSFNGSTWSSPKTFAASTGAGPSLAVRDNLLYAGWRGFNTILVTYSSFNGTTWSAAHSVPHSKQNGEVGITLANYSGSLVASWTKFPCCVPDYSFGP